MNKFTLGMVAAACMASGLAANAALIDVYDPPNINMGGTGDPVTIFYGLSYDSTGWASITSATVSIFLKDNDGKTETAQRNPIQSSGGSILTTATLSPLDGDGLSKSYFDISVLGLVSPGMTDTLFGSISAPEGDFFFDRAELNMEFSPVPVPAAVWLFGSAIAALGFSRRRNTNA